MIPEQVRSQTNRATKKSVAIGMWASPNSFSDVHNDTGYGAVVQELIYQPLVMQNEQMEYEGRLASDWSISADQTRFTFRIRRNARWTDGHPITAHDVAFTFSIIADPETVTYRRTLYTVIKGLDEKGMAPGGVIEGIRVLDDHTIEFTTKAPVDVDSFLENIGANLYIVPKHVLESVPRSELHKHAYGLHPKVTSGPFKFVRYETDRYIVLEKNPDYFLGSPRLDEVVVRIVPRHEFVAALDSGLIDVGAGNGVGEVSITEWEKILQMPHLEPIAFPGTTYQYLDINVAQPHLSDIRVRRALAHALDRQAIVDRLLNGQGTVIDTPILTLSKYYDPKWRNVLTYNPDLARRLLVEAGWDFSRRLTLLVPMGYPVREQSVEMVQANFAAIGLQVEIRKMEFDARMALARTGAWEISLLGFSCTTADPNFAHAVNAGAPYNDRRLPGPEHDGETYANPQLEQLLTMASQTAQFEERKRLYDQVQAVFLEDLPFIPLYNPNALCVVNRRVVGIRPGPWETPWNAHLWDVR